MDKGTGDLDQQYAVLPAVGSAVDPGARQPLLPGQSGSLAPAATPSSSALAIGDPEDLDPEEAGLDLAAPPLVEGYRLAPGCVYPWEQLANEGQKAYAAYCVYRDMGYARSCSAVAKALGKHIALIARWSTVYSWVDRTRRYEISLDRNKRSQIEADRLGMLERHRGTAEKVLSLVERWVDQKLEQDPSDIPDTQIAALLRVAAVVERQSLGLPADQTATYAEHRHTHTLELPEAAGATSPVQDWLAQLRERAAALGITPDPSPSTDTQTIDAVARELGLDEVEGEGA